MVIANHAGAAPKKRQRVNSNSRLSSTAAVVIDSSRPDLTLTEASSHKTPPAATIRRSASLSSLPTSSPGGFNDSTTADVILRLYLDHPSSPFDDSESVPAFDSVDQPDVEVYLHSHVLTRSKYFATLLSDRWQSESIINNDGECESNDKKIHHFNLGISAGSIDDHLTVLQLLYTNDFSNAIKQRIRGFVHTSSGQVRDGVAVDILSGEAEWGLERRRRGR